MLQQVVARDQRKAWQAASHQLPELLALVCIAFGAGAQSLAPWTMGIGFGFGQWLFAAILHRSLGDDHD